MSRWTFGLAVMIAAAACDRPATRSESVVERTTRGDTTIVRTVSGSEWGDTARLVPELRIGALDGPPEVAFGRVDFVAADRAGAIYVYDGQARALRQFDSLGNFVRTIGRRGRGPGEYENLLGVQGLPGGEIAAYDAGNHRINVHSPDGSFLRSWTIQADGQVYSADAFSSDSAGRLYVEVRITPASERPRRYGLLQFDPATGTLLDTLQAPVVPMQSMERPVLYAPSWTWAFHPSGSFIVGSNAAYTFELRRPAGTVLRIERMEGLVPFAPEERAEIEAGIATRDPPIISFGVNEQGERINVVRAARPTLADAKPVYQDLVAADDGRIWVRRHTPAVKGAAPAEAAPPPPPPGAGPSPPPPRRWQEPAIHDVFEPDGRYLGAVVAPDLTALHQMRGDHAWGVQRGESDEEYVVRLRLVRDGR